MTNPNLRELLRRPVVVAPMAGGPSTPSLVVRRGRGGRVRVPGRGLQVGGGDGRRDRRQYARASADPFGVNVFVPGAPTRERRRAVDVSRRRSAPDADAVGATLGEPSWDDDHFDEKIAALLADPPSVVSFTFGCPSAEVIAAFRGAGCVVAVTVTQPSEAVIAAKRRCRRACAYRATRPARIEACSPMTMRRLTEIPLVSLIAKIAEVTDLPQIAAGGIMHRDQVRRCSRPEPSPRSAARRSCAAWRAERTPRTKPRSPMRASPRPQ